MGFKTWLNLSVLVFASASLIGCNSTQKEKNISSSTLPVAGGKGAPPPEFPVMGSKTAPSYPMRNTNPSVSQGFPSSNNPNIPVGSTFPQVPGQPVTGPSLSSTGNVPPLPQSPNPFGTTTSSVNGPGGVGNSSAFATQAAGNPLFSPSTNPLVPPQGLPSAPR